MFNRVNKYIDKYRSPSDDYTEKVNRWTHLKTLDPGMASGPAQCKLLEILSRLVTPKNILEIGTFTGMATISLSKGLQPGGRIITIEKNKEAAFLAKAVFDESEDCDKITLLEGDALEIIPGLNEQFDLVYIDADKLEYDRYFELINSKVKPGGLILIDNVLWKGRVLEEAKDNTTQNIHDLNLRISQDPRFENIILPFRDGINLVYKSK